MNKTRLAHSNLAAIELDEDTLASERPQPLRPQSMVVPRPTTTSDVCSGAEALVQMLVQLGVEHAFGVFGGGIAPFCEALSRSPIRLLHFRHEAGAAFAAIESSLASGKLTVVLATTGPGLTNLHTGMVAARSEGAKVLFVSGGTSAAQRGRMAFQETSAYASAVSPLFSQGPLFHYAAMIEDAAELEVVASRLGSGLTRPGGFVAHLGLPLSTQTSNLSNFRPSRLSSGLPPVCDMTQAKQVVELLAEEPFVIWAGFGARHAAPAIRELASRTGAHVMCTPRGKGIMPETDALYLGVTGLGGHAQVERYLARERPARALVLGSRLGEMSSFWRAELVPQHGLIHVDLDPEVFGAAFPAVPTIGVQSEVGAFVESLLELWPHKRPQQRARAVDAAPRPKLEPRASGVVRPSFLMSRIQRHIVEGSDALVLTEAGNAFALGSHYLYFTEPNRYRVSTGFGSMGQAAAGVLGAALGSRGKAVAILGDGAMLMQNEINTAATYGIDVVWIVLNDARYGMIAQGMTSIGWQPFETDFSRANFLAIARGMGGDGERVETEEQVDGALLRALHARGPFVVDVTIDPAEMAPAIGRNQSLVQQGVNGGAR
jgi:acetolactate synthase I/II/III large subunit